MTVTKYCYRCGKTHAIDEMRKVPTKAGFQWRCVQSIEAIKKTKTERDKFGLQISKNNRKSASESQHGKIAMYDKLSVIQ